MENCENDRHYYWNTSCIDRAASSRHHLKQATFFYEVSWSRCICRWCNNCLTCCIRQLNPTIPFKTKFTWLRSTHDGSTTVEGCWHMLKDSQLLCIFVHCIFILLYIVYTLLNKAWGLTSLQPAAWAVVAIAFSPSQWLRYGRIFSASYHMTLKILCMPTQRRANLPVFVGAPFVLCLYQSKSRYISNIYIYCT